MKPYHPANLKRQPFAPWRVIALAWAGKLLGVQFKVDGIPYGAPYDRELWHRYHGIDGYASGEGSPGGTGG